MQGANTNANSNGPKRQRMKMCAVSVLLFMFSLLLVLCFCFVASVFVDVASVFHAVVFARSLARMSFSTVFSVLTQTTA